MYAPQVMAATDDSAKHVAAAGGSRPGRRVAARLIAMLMQARLDRQLANGAEIETDTALDVHAAACGRSGRGAHWRTRCVPSAIKPLSVDWPTGSQWTKNGSPGQST